MKRLHVSLSVTDLDRSIAFYSSLFNMQPTIEKDDYAKWMLDDPRVNFSISTRGDQGGVDHLGIQVDSEDELGEVAGRLQQAGAPVLAQPDATCCYARSEKNWIYDPDRVAWETFYTHGDSPVYGSDFVPTPDGERECCGNQQKAEDSCC